MKLFADTGYWIALLNPNDVLHERATALAKTTGRRRIYTTDAVLSELMAAFGERGPELRGVASKFSKDLLKDKNVVVVQWKRDLFNDGLDLYAKRNG